jgi:hypothetical protein
MHRPASAAVKACDAPAGWAMVSSQTKKEIPLLFYSASRNDKNLSDSLDITRSTERLLRILNGMSLPPYLPDIRTAIC